MQNQSMLKGIISGVIITVTSALILYLLGVSNNVFKIVFVNSNKESIVMETSNAKSSFNNTPTLIQTETETTNTYKMDTQQSSIKDVMLSSLNYIVEVGTVKNVTIPIDNLGNTYSDGLSFGYALYGDTTNYREYVVNSLFSKIEGRFVLPDMYKNSTTKGVFKIIGDGENLYTSQVMTGGIEPIDFSVVISDVNRLRIEVDITDPSYRFGWHCFYVVNAILFK